MAWSKFIQKTNGNKTPNRTLPQTQDTEKDKSVSRAQLKACRDVPVLEQTPNILHAKRIITFKYSLIYLSSQNNNYLR